MASLYIITVTKDNVDPRELTVNPGDVVAWIPATEDVKVRIEFQDKSPFKRKKLPDSANTGEGVLAIVKKKAEFIADAGDVIHEYKEIGNRRRRRLRPRADPVIIVRDNRRGKPKKAGAKKSARKK